MTFDKLLLPYGEHNIKSENLEELVFKKKNYCIVL